MDKVTTAAQLLLYVVEVTYTFLGSAGLVPPDCHTFQKFSRQP